MRPLSSTDAEVGDDSASVDVRLLNERDLPEMVLLEQLSWPNDTQANEQQLEDRLRVFPNGCFGAFFQEQIIGMASTQILSLPHPVPLETWSNLTADGWISETHRPDGNCLHFVSVCVHPRQRGQGIGKALNLARLKLGKKLRLECALTDTRLPGLSRFLKDDPMSNAEEYLHRILTTESVEPVVMMYLELGFEPLGLLPRCMKSDIESADYGLAMAKDLRRP